MDTDIKIYEAFNRLIGQKNERKLFFPPSHRNLPHLYSPVQLISSHRDVKFSDPEYNYNK